VAFKNRTESKKTEDDENKLLVEVAYREDEESVISSYNYQSVTKVREYNTIRYKIFNYLKKEFIDPVISKGLKKAQQKAVFENNYDEFLRFLERKIRYWLASFLNSKELQRVIVRYNNHLVEELNYNYLTTRESMDRPDISKLTAISNEYIQKSNVTVLPRKIGEYILSKNEYKELILGFFNEFLKYLIIF